MRINQPRVNIEMKDFSKPFEKLVPGAEHGIFLIVIYENPIDMPGLYVARLFAMDIPTPYIVKRHTLEAILETIPGHMVSIVPHYQDDPNIKAVYV